APPSLIINTTTWGETDASEAGEFAFPFEGLAAPGNGFFDLNNRTSSLQATALRAGMNVMSGTFMQRVTNACRAALLKAATS
ncbi:MAG: shikimate dehydrogenase, partial [Streptomycetaceae bacterium]|nr:shikimate dehydrogenase [Streptomycetaceae bacterium]